MRVERVSREPGGRARQVESKGYDGAALWIQPWGKISLEG